MPVEGLRSGGRDREGRGDKGGEMILAAPELNKRGDVSGQLNAGDACIDRGILRQIPSSTAIKMVTTAPVDVLADREQKHRQEHEDLDPEHPTGSVSSH